MAVTRQGAKRQARREAIRGQRRALAVTESGGLPDGTGFGTRRFVAVGTVPMVTPEARRSVTALSLRVGSSYEVAVGPGFDAVTLARLVRTLEQL